MILSKQLMFNPFTDSVDTYENWVFDGLPQDVLAVLIPVEKNDQGDWVEIQ